MRPFTPAPRTVIYLGNVSRRWERDIQRATDAVLVFSPYLTSKAAERIVGAGHSSTCEIHTVFSAMNFAQGASSLTTLERLIAKGHIVFEVPNLHAKLVVVPGVGVSIGSQNLTSRGANVNLEATVVLSDPALVPAVRARVTEWLRERQPITLERINDMKALVGPLRRSYEAFRRKAAKADDHVQGQAVAREREQAFTTALKALPRSRKVVVAEVAFRSFGEAPYTLVAKNGGRLTQGWTVGASRHELERVDRYVCINETRGWFGWARVADTRVTFIEDGLSSASGINVDRRRCDLNLDAVWTDAAATSRNLSIRVTARPYGDGGVTIGAFFAFDRFDFVAWHETGDEGTDQREGSRKMALWIKRNDVDFKHTLARKLLSSFRYKKALSGGKNVQRFFGDSGVRYALRVGVFKGWPLLLASRL